MKQWKYLTFAIGLLLLIVGSYYFSAPDWDIPISIIMATFTFLTAGWTVDVLLLKQWKKLPLVLFFAWWAVDGCYWLYWSTVNPDALVMRDVNWPASLCLYAICGVLWSRAVFNIAAQELRKSKRF